MSENRVLVADDEVHILNVVSFKLRNAGLEVITARDGTEAFELAKSEVPDLMVVDYQMPGMNGLELCLALREEPGTTHIPAVMLTARGLDIEQPELDRAGICLVMPKPFSPQEVLANIEEILEQKTSARSGTE
jgi:two-component system alkaline phosphatase synthesis response regulator PhoP